MPSDIRLPPVFDSGSAVSLSGINFGVAEHYNRVDDQRLDRTAGLLPAGSGERATQLGQNDRIGQAKIAGLLLWAAYGMETTAERASNRHSTRWSFSQRFPSPLEVRPVTRRSGGRHRPPHNPVDRRFSALPDDRHGSRRPRLKVADRPRRSDPTPQRDRLGHRRNHCGPVAPDLRRPARGRAWRCRRARGGPDQTTRTLRGGRPRLVTTKFTPMWETGRRNSGPRRSANRPETGQPAPSRPGGSPSRGNHEVA